MPFYFFNNMIETDYGMEINVVRHCTNVCVVCNHASTAFTEKFFMEPETLRRDLDVMKNHIRTKLLFCQGGEPLLHPKIVEMIRICVESQIAKQAGILTNGKLLPRMGDDFWEILRDGHCELRMSVYPDLDPSIVTYAEDMAAKWSVSIRPQQINTFKPLFLKNDGRTYHGCPWNRCLCVHQGWFYICPLSTFFPKQFMGIPEHIDGIPIEGMTDELLNTMLQRTHPLETCKICAGATGDSIPWHQNKSKAEWLTEAGMTPELIA